LYPCSHLFRDAVVRSCICLAPLLDRTIVDDADRSEFAPRELRLALALYL
jgi:hypothetical protein